ncbi:uncharacterized protein LOC113501421 [Trichoplusia ni]|uniref:Uncharacterized protein LOC113501421 n=1 Tax=Trichoplusia ni TaxID=7111 RepID=A0A7E5WDU7_TRINI|nr:uncharacterized protein LOC113501421 [Trichoplusia ni]
MEFIYLLSVCLCALMSMCQSLAVDKPNADLPAPNLWKFESIDDPANKSTAQRLTWTAVDSGDEQDPVIGYKVKVWEVNKVKTIVYKSQGGKFVATEIEEYPRMSSNVIPESSPTVLVVPSNETTAVYPVKVDVMYQFAVLAFTKTREGPLSSPTHIRLHPTEDDLKSGSV